MDLKFIEYSYGYSEVEAVENIYNRMFPVLDEVDDFSENESNEEQKGE